MKIFGFNITRAKAPAPDVATRTQYSTTAAQGPLTPWFQDYYLRKVSGDFYEALREGIPVIDAAIRRLISLNGTIKVIGTNGPLVSELEEFCINVPVNDHQKGIHAFLENFSNEVFEQGFALPEFIATPGLDDIAQLRVPDSKQIIFRRNNDGATEPWYRYINSFLPASVTRYTSPQTLVERILTATYNQACYINSGWEVKLNPANKLYFSINNENADPYGVSLMRSMEFCAKLLMTMQNSLGNVWERFGDPSYHVNYKTTKRDLGGTDLESRRQKIQTDFDNAIRAKRAGKSADFVTAVNTDADLEIKIIGSDGQVLELEVPAQHVLDQIVSKTGLPPWMLSVSSRTVQGLATLEVEAALQDAKIRQLAMLPELVRLFSVFLRLRGRTWKSINLSGDPEKPGDWGIIFETPNLRDLVAQAQARFLNAQADQMQSAATTVPSIPKAPPPKSVGAVREPPFHTCKDIHGQKEEQRPTPWPELDNVETGYENRLKADWEELRGKIFTIARLTDADIAMGMTGQRSVGAVREPPSSKDPDPFTFTEEQRAQVFKSLEGMIGEYAPDAAGSPITWYYGQSYSLGLIQAARMVGAERPILDIIKNREIFAEMVKSGFELFKNNAELSVGSIISEMEAHMLAGSNPLSVADRLKSKFKGQDINWERLARTEMSGAAEQAKVNEWKEWGVNVKKAIIAGRDTHPRCRCANTVVQVDGEWRLKFSPAPDACALCFSLAT
jgi:hypothetical protein